MQHSFSFLQVEAKPAPRLALAFHSGMSRAKDFRAAADAGVAIGVVAGELATATIFLGVPRFIGKGGSVFVDSGAFAEFKTGVAPDFDAVLRVYEMLASHSDLQEIGSGQLYVVSPDKVGDQLETLARLEQHAGRVRALIEQGCQVIFPLQRGVIPATEMLARAVAILGTDRFVAGIPSNKEALSLAECASLQHHAFHILGRVQMNQDQVERLTALTASNPGAVLTADANWLRSRLGLVSNMADQERRMRVAAPAANDFATWLQPTARGAAITAALLQEKAWGKAA